MAWDPGSNLRLSSTGDGNPRENSPFINNVEVERESYFEGKNMALFEVILFQFVHEEGMLVKSLWESKGVVPAKGSLGR